MPANRREFGAMAAAACLALPACSGERSGAKRVLFSADSHPEGYPTVDAIRFIGAFLRKQTGGRLDLKVYPGGQLGSEGSTLEIAMFGGLDISRVFSAALNNIAPLTTLFSLPFLFKSVEHMRRTADGEVGREMLASLEPFGLKGLCIYDSGARGFYTGSRVIDRPGAIKGLKIRVPNSDIFLSTVRALGANPTPMNYGEVYQGLVQNVIDGAENNWPSYVSTRHAEVARYYSETGHIMAPDMLVMSARTWRNFSADDQALVMEAARRSVTVMRDLWDQRVIEAKSAFTASGGEVLENIDITPFRERMATVYERFVTPEVAPLIARVDAIGAEISQ